MKFGRVAVAGLLLIAFAAASVRCCAFACLLLCCWIGFKPAQVSVPQVFLFFHRLPACALPASRRRAAFAQQLSILAVEAVLRPGQAEGLLATRISQSISASEVSTRGRPGQPQMCVVRRSAPNCGTMLLCFSRLNGMASPGTTRRAQRIVLFRVLPHSSPLACVTRAMTNAATTAPRMPVQLLVSLPCGRPCMSAVRRVALATQR